MQHHPPPLHPFPRGRAIHAVHTVDAPRHATRRAPDRDRVAPICDGCHRRGDGPWHAADDGAQHCDACHALVLVLAALPRVRSGSR